MDWDEMSFEEKVECCVENFKEMLLSARHTIGIHIEFDWTVERDRAYFSQDVTIHKIKASGDKDWLL